MGTFSDTRTCSLYFACTARYKTILKKCAIFVVESSPTGRDNFKLVQLS